MNYKITPSKHRSASFDRRSALPWLLAATAVLSSCSTGADSSKNSSTVGLFGLAEASKAAAVTMARAEIIGYDASLLEQTRSFLEQARAPLKEGPDEYLTQQQYQRRALSYALTAYSYLLQQDPRSARAYYQDAFQTMQRGENNLTDLLRRRATARAEAIAAFSAISSVAFGIASAHARPSAVPTLNFYRSVALRLPDLTADVSARREAYSYTGTGMIAADSVRMLVMPVPGTDFWSIGRIETSTGRCTGALVDFRIVVTNAHCLAPKEGGHYSAGASRFVLESPLWKWEIPISDVRLHQGGSWDGRQENDWALAVLPYHPTSYKYITPQVGDDSILRGGSLAVSGYSGDLNDGRYQTMDWGCNILRASPQTANSENNNLIEYTCKTAPGSSGSPVWLIDPSQRVDTMRSGRRRLTMIGLNAAYYPGAGRALGPTASQFIPTLRQLAIQIAPDRPGDDMPMSKELWESDRSQLVVEHMTHRLAE